MSGSGASLTAAGADPSAGVDVKTLGVGSIGATNGFGSGLEPGGTMNLTNTTIVTEGQDAHAVAVSGAGSETHLGAGNALTTQGDGAIGIYATGGGVVNGTGGVVTITTSGANSEATGLSAFGVNADGPGSQVNLPGLTVTTAGANAYGLLRQQWWSDRREDGPSIATHGAGAIGVYASGAGSSIAVGGGATIATTGASAAGRQADAGGLADAKWRFGHDDGKWLARPLCRRRRFAVCASNVAVATNGVYDFRPGRSFGLSRRTEGASMDWGGSSRPTGTSSLMALSPTAAGSQSQRRDDDGDDGRDRSFGLFVNGGVVFAARDRRQRDDGWRRWAGLRRRRDRRLQGFASPGDPTGGAMTLTDTTITTSGAAAVGVEADSGGVTAERGVAGDFRNRFARA